MPLYSICCDTCGQKDTIFRKVDARDEAIPECECGGSMHRVVDAPYVTPDIQPYQAVAVDKATGRVPVIESRTQHREFLKRNGYIEVGNERIGRKEGEVRGDFNLRKDLTEATREVLGKQR